MKILYNRYLDKQKRLFIPIERFQSLEATDETPTAIKLLNVENEKTVTISYAEFQGLIKDGTLTQIIK